MQVKQIVSVCALMFVGLSAQAQTQAAGLWEHSMTMKSDDPKVDAAMAQMQKQLASMPPEQRKQMEAAMASRGVKLGANGSSVKVCITKEEAAKPPEARMNSSNCTQKEMTRSGNTMKFKYECTQPPSTGEGEMTFVSDKAYSGKTSVTSQREGRTMQMTMEMQGKWLSSDCGDVKPRTPPAK